MRVRREMSKGLSLIVGIREVFESTDVGNGLKLHSMRGGMGMPKLKIHDQKSAKAEVQPLIRTNEPGYSLYLKSGSEGEESKISQEWKGFTQWFAF